MAKNPSFPTSCANATVESESICILRIGDLVKRCGVFTGETFKLACPIFVQDNSE